MYGPSVSSISSLIVPWLKLYITASKLSSQQTPYIFHPRSDTSKPHSSAHWTQIVSSCFARHSPGNVHLPPKNLRASFITFVKGQTELSDVPAILQSASLAMRHSTTTQACMRTDSVRSTASICVCTCLVSDRVIDSC